MNSSQKFQQEYLGSFESPDRNLYNFAKRYHDLCEEFDGLCCSSLNERNVAVPTTAAEFSLINRHALEVRKRIIEEGKCMGYSSLNITEAIKEYRRS